MTDSNVIPLLPKKPEAAMRYLDRLLDAQGVTDPDVRELARKILEQALKEADIPCP